MGKRQFLLKMGWAWDYLNTELATFTIEGDAEEEDKDSPLSLNKSLTPETFRHYHEKHKETLQSVFDKLCQAVNGNPMSDCVSLIELHELYPGSFRIISDFLGLIVFPIGLTTVKPLCTFDDQGNVVFSPDTERS